MTPILNQLSYDDDLPGYYEITVNHRREHPSSFNLFTECLTNILKEHANVFENANGRTNFKNLITSFQFQQSISQFLYNILITINCTRNIRLIRLTHTDKINKSIFP